MPRFSAGLFRDSDGSEVVEYALVIALVVLGVVLALSAGVLPLAGTFADLYRRLGICLTGSITC